MTETSDSKPEGGKGSSPDQKPDGEPKMVPLAVLLEERAKYDARFAKLEEQMKAAKPQEPANPQYEELNKTVRELTTRERRRELSRSLGLGDKQTELVEQIIQATNLNPAEALLVAKGRDAKLFESNEGSSFDPSMHGNLGTTRGAQPGAAPQKDDTQERVALIKSLAGKDEMKRDDLRHNLVGSMAARALGLKHHKLPIT